MFVLLDYRKHVDSDQVDANNSASPKDWWDFFHVTSIYVFKLKKCKNNVIEIFICLSLSVTY